MGGNERKKERKWKRKPAVYNLSRRSLPIFLSVLENTRIRARSIMGMMVVVPWGLGMVLYGGVGYLLKHWRYATLTLTLLYLFLFVGIWYEYRVGDFDDGRSNDDDDDDDYGSKNHSIRYNNKHYLVWLG